MKTDRVSRSLYCAVHGALMARVVDHSIWDGEVVQVLYRSQAYDARYVVRFSSGKRRTVWFNDVRLLGVRQPAIPSPGLCSTSTLTCSKPVSWTAWGGSS
jgi:hypothetical protein